MQRRTFMTGAALLPLLAAAGCQPKSADLNVFLLERSVPLRLVKGFRQQQSEQSVNFETESTLIELYQRLLSWQQESASSQIAADWVTMGTDWLRGVIQQNLIQPLPTSSWPQAELAPIWRQIVTRNAAGETSGDGEAIWGIPYRWGSLMMIYRPQHWQGTNWRPRTWQDLLRSQTSSSRSSLLTHNIALPNHPRIVTGIALKMLGASANTADLEAVPDLIETLTSLHQQVRFYSSEHYLEPLLLEDVSLAVGWSTDILPILQQYRQFEAVIPAEGTLLSADLWVRPAQSAGGTEVSPVAQAWIDYCFKPDVATELSIFSQGGSPLFWDKQAPAALAEQTLLTLDRDLQQRSEFLLPLEANTKAQLKQLWQTVQLTAKP